MPKKTNNVIGNAEYIRRMNRSLIVKTIMDKKSISRSELEVETSLTLPTIMRIVSILIEEGLVIEVGKGDSSGGRKPIMLELNPNKMYFIGVSVQRMMCVVVTDISGNIISSYKCFTKVNAVPGTVRKQILEGIETVISQSNIERSKIKYIGIGIPGTKFKHKASVNFPFEVWADFELRQWQEPGMFPFPVVFENVAKLGALGELMFGSKKNCRDFIYIFADYGIGAGIVIDGKLFRGSSGVACEFGHTIVEMNGEVCYCGSEGCLEMYCSTGAIVKRFLNDEKATASLKESLIQELDFSLLVDAAYKGDETALWHIRQSAHALGIGLSGLINLFNPSHVIIGGELAESCVDYTEIVACTAKGNIFRSDAASVDILASSMKDDTSVKGAVALAMAQVFEHYQF